MLVDHYTETPPPINKGFPGDRLKWVFDQDLDSTAKLVLIVLSSHYNVKREDAFPSIGRIARLASLGYKAVWKALGRLEAKGLIEANRKVGRVTRWQVHVGPRLVEQEQVDQVDPQEPQTPRNQEPDPKTQMAEATGEDLAYWRKVYDSGRDLDGCRWPMQSGSSRILGKTPLISLWIKNLTYVLGTEVPMSQRPRYLCPRDRLTRKGY